MKIKVICLKNHRYAGKARRSGETYHVPASHLRFLSSVGWVARMLESQPPVFYEPPFRVAEIAAPQVEAEPEPEPEVEPEPEPEPELEPEAQPEAEGPPAEEKPKKRSHRRRDDREPKRRSYRRRDLEAEE
jgi:hypothetical protein